MARRISDITRTTSIGTSDLFVIDALVGGAYVTKSIATSDLFANVASMNVGSASAIWPATYSMPVANQAALTVIDPIGQVGLYVAGRSSDWNTNLITTNSIPFCLLSVHDRTVTSPQPTGVWGAYWQFNKTASASSLQQQGVEWSFQNLGSSVLTDPYSAQPVVGGTHILTLDSGIGPLVGNPVSSALRIVNNGNTFNTGILFGNNSLTSGANAIQMPTGYGITWYSAAAAPGVKLIANSSAANIAITNGSVSIGTATPVASTALTIAGIGSTSATFALVIENLAATALFYVRNDGVIFHGCVAVPSVTNSFALGTSSLNWSNVFSTLYSVGSNQVVGARATGWTVATGTPSRATFTTSGVTLATLAGVVMALEQDLITHGLIGT